MYGGASAGGRHATALALVLDCVRARWLREFCGTRLCSVVLRRALESIRNGHPASEVVINQFVTIAKIPVSTVWLASNQVVGSSTTWPSGQVDRPLGRAERQRGRGAKGPEVISPGAHLPIFFENCRRLSNVRCYQFELPTDKKPVRQRRRGADRPQGDPKRERAARIIRPGAPIRGRRFRGVVQITRALSVAQMSLVKNEPVMIAKIIRQRSVRRSQLLNMLRPRRVVEQFPA
jgi:hypothetical protein